jgi:hypothetical protein
MNLRVEGASAETELVGLGRSQVIHRHHGEGPHTDYEGALIHEEVWAVVWCRLGQVLIARHDSKIEEQTGTSLRKKEKSSDAPDRSLSLTSP